jgi:hypothetical protein
MIALSFNIRPLVRELTLRSAHALALSVLTMTKNTPSIQHSLCSCAVFVSRFTFPGSLFIAYARLPRNMSPETGDTGRASERHGSRAERMARQLSDKLISGTSIGGRDLGADRGPAIPLPPEGCFGAKHLFPHPVDTSIPGVTWSGFFLGFVVPFIVRNVYVFIFCTDSICP